MSAVSITTGTDTTAGESRRRAFFADLGVRVKVLTAVAAAALVALVVGIVGLVALSGVSASAQLIYRSNLASVTALGQLKSAATQARVDLANQVLSVADADTKKFTDAFAADRQSVAAAMTAYQDSMPASDPQLIEHLQASWDAYVDVASNKMIRN